MSAPNTCSLTSELLASAMAAKFIELEQATASMTLEDAHKRYRFHQWDVFERLTDIGRFCTVKNGWTEGGVRHFLALLELYEFLIPEYDAQKGDAS